MRGQPLVKRVGERFAAVPRSGVREVLERALAVPDAIRLEIGDPDFPTPPHVVEAALRAAADGATHYTPAAGLPSLRAAAAASAAERCGIACAPEQVVVTTGACGGLFAMLLVLLDPGDEVLVPDPGWTGYAGIVSSAGGVARPYPLDAASGFRLDVDAVEAAIGPQTRAVVVNSPGNPAGAVFSRPALEALVALAERRGIWVLSDEAYEAITFDEGHVSTAAAAGGPVISFFTCSKTYAMTGWRVGYAVAPPDLAAAAARAQESVVTSVSSVSQAAAEAALTGPQDAVGLMRESYRSRRDLATELLDRDGVPYVRPSGAFYLLVDVGSSGLDSRAFALSLLDEQRVAVVPGAAFGAGAEGLVRVSLCVAPELLLDGLERLTGALEQRAVA